jgi:hypothetical protein
MRKACLRAFRLLDDPLADIRALTCLFLVCFTNLSVSWLFLRSHLFIRFCLCAGRLGILFPQEG